MNSRLNPKLLFLSEDLPFRVRPGRTYEKRSNIYEIKFFSRVHLLRRARRTGTKKNGSFGRGAARLEPRLFSQRVVVKARVVRTKNNDSRGLAEHFRYLQRSGVGIDGGDAKVFSIEGDLQRQDLPNLAKEWTSDRHHFRFIISPEEASDLDLKEYTKLIVKQMECDLKTKLEWIAVPHYNTDNHHVHLLVRGKDDQGADLVMSRDYISRGVRVLSQEIATRELGLRSELDVERSQLKSLSVARITGVDRELELLQRESKDGKINLRQSAQNPAMRRTQISQIQRLEYLETLGLAREDQLGVWRTREDFTDRLKELSIEKDIIKTMHQRMVDMPSGFSLKALTAEKIPPLGIQATVIHRGLVDELYDTQYIVVKTRKGDGYYLPLSGRTLFDSEDVRLGKSVFIEVQNQSVATRSDRTIEDEAKRNFGVYDSNLHLSDVPQTTRLPAGVSAEDYVANHRRRARSLVRLGFAEEVETGKWRIVDNLGKRLEEKSHKALSIQSLERRQDISRDV